MKDDRPLEKRKNAVHKKIILLFVLIWITLLPACQKSIDTIADEVIYSFIAAGHTYGAPGVDNIGFHPPFSAQFDYFSEIAELRYCFLTGDVVISSTLANWEEIASDLADLEAESHIAPGNHDLGDTTIYNTVNGSRYYSFMDGDDLFVILDPGTTGWQIMGDQRAMLVSAIENSPVGSGSIFLFMHQLIWYEEESRYESCPPNSLEGRSGTATFESDILPLLAATEKQVVIYAGDVGAFENGCALMTHEIGKIKLIASGMGGGKRDNVVITKVHRNDSLSYQIIALNGEDRSAMGLLEDYRI